MMEYSNSPLVDYTELSPNCTSPRSQGIDTVTIHCVEGQCSAEALGRVFANPKRKASSNYGVDKDGRIGLYVEEKDRSWCSSCAANDNRAITIEVASDTKPPYAVTDAAFAALIDLLTDICRRNGIPELRFLNDPSLVGEPEKQNMTLHRWFADTSCPGEFLLGLHGRIAREVNARLQPVRVGDLVSILPGAVYANGVKVPESVLAQNWYVKSVDEKTGRTVIDRSEDGKRSILSAIDRSWLLPVPVTGGGAEEGGQTGDTDGEPLPGDESTPENPEEAGESFTVRVRKENGEAILSASIAELQKIFGA